MLFSILKQSLFSVIRKISLTGFLKVKYAEFELIQFFIRFFYRNISKSTDPITFTSSVGYRDFLKNCQKETIQDNILRANEILDNKFNLLGIKDISWGSEIPWHSDANTQHQWDNKFHEELNPVSTVHDNYEKKHPWELSRLQYLFVLYKAYLITNQKAYHKKIIHIIDDWLTSNPPFSGINWVNSMEVGLRATNLILIASYANRKLPEKLLLHINYALLFHFFYIVVNPEISFSRKFQLKRAQKIHYIFRNNHYLFNIIGLVFICLYFNRMPLMRLYGKRAVSLFFKEIEFQVLDDGADFEGSIGYHGYVLETILFACILLKKRNVSLPKACLEKLFKMLDFTLHYTKPNGEFPIIGDFDSGRLFTLGKYSKASHLNLLAIGAVLLESAHFKTDLANFNEEAFWLFGKEGKQTFERLPCRAKPISSKAFEEGGFYIMRNASDFMIISTGNNIDRGSGGHFHNDCFSFELYACDKSFIVDPGCYTYASKKWRNLFRSSKYHNTLVIDNEEINRFDENNMFFMENDARPEVLEWEVGNDCDVFVGQHRGYCRLTEPVTVTRKITFYKKERYWEIKDILFGMGKHEIEWNFHLFPLNIQISDSNPLSVSTDEKGTNLQIMPLKHVEQLTMKNKEGWVSYEYGEMTEAPILSYIANIDLDESEIEFSFLLKPF